MIGRVLQGALVLVLAGSLSRALAQPPASGTAPLIAQLGVLTSRLSDDARRARSSGDEDALAALAAQRQALLARLVVEAPGEVLRLALPTSERAILPAPARELTEEHVDVSGTVEVSFEDHQGFSRLHHVLDTGAARLTLHFSSDAPGWTSGQHVRVRGVRVENALALDGDRVTTTTGSDQVLGGTTGEQRTLVVLVSFRDATATPYSPAQAADVVFSQTDGYLRENSSGAAWLTGDVYGWYTIDMDSTVCDTTTLATLAKAAAEGGGAVLSTYSRFVYAFPRNACTWSGFGSVGGSPSQAWINGTMSLAVVGHEIGHNLGLYHSRHLDCGATSIGSNCAVDEYGDTLDLMGATRGHFTAFQKERLGWLAPSQIVTLTSAASGSYTLEPYSSPGSGVKALKILKSTDPATGLRTFYYVEQRQALGYDAFMSSWTNVMTGVAVHTGSETGGNTSYLLDMTPETSSWYDPALVGGRTFEDAAAGLVLQAISAGASGAAMSIAFTPPVAACMPAAPLVTLASGSTSVSAGTTVSYGVTVANRDSTACPSSTFTLTPGVPAGWAWTLDAASVSVAPGASASRTLRVTSPVGAAGGTYQVSVAATDTALTSRTASGSAPYTVVAAAPAVQVTTDRSSYLRTDTAVLTARVVSGTAPMPGVAVSFLIRKADGRTTTGTATSDASGYATYRFRFRAKDPVGTWQVSASAAGASSAVVSFTVVR